MITGIDPKKIQSLIDAGDETWTKTQDKAGRDVYVKRDTKENVFVMVDAESSQVVVQSMASLRGLGRSAVRFYDRAGDLGLGEGDRVGITLAGRGLLGPGSSGGNEIPESMYKFDIVNGGLKIAPGQLPENDGQVLEEIINRHVDLSLLSAEYLAKVDHMEVPRSTEDSGKVAKK